MKPNFPLIAIAAIALLLALFHGQARAQQAPACEGCSAKQKQIEALQAELATLRGPAEAPPAPAPTPEPAAPAAPAESAAPEAPVATSDYTVVAGDNLSKIARKHGCTTQQLAKLNGMQPEGKIHIGQKIKVPANSEAAPTTLEPAPEPAKPAATYTIQEGDTYYGIARKLNIPVNKLMAANPNIKPNQLAKGRTIQLPDGAAPAPEPQTLTPADPTPPAQGTPQAPAGGATQPIRQITIDSEITYGAFAEKHGTSVERLNALNDLNLTSTTILAKGSELFVPAQP
ncbi:MAG TPA: LysM peptidoglycan-binding domain-containing protein [Luteolibacter sp.]|nr:LysM peptidoglycan-binding domain-containing protein [Luteolibacter sp.]